MQSDPIYQHLGRTGRNKVNAIKDLYLEESFKYVKDNLNKFVTKLVENEDHQLTLMKLQNVPWLRKSMTIRPQFFLVCLTSTDTTVLNSDDFNIKELMLFKPDLYGKNVSVLD